MIDYNKPMDELEKYLNELELQADDAANRGDLLEHKRLEDRWLKLALLNVDLEDLERLKKINRSLVKKIEAFEFLKQSNVTVM